MIGRLFKAAEIGLVEWELVQEVGRSGLLGNDFKVHLFSNDIPRGEDCGTSELAGMHIRASS